MLLKSLSIKLSNKHGLIQMQEPVIFTIELYTRVQEREYHFGILHHLSHLAHYQ